MLKDQQQFPLRNRGPLDVIGCISFCSRISSQSPTAGRTKNAWIQSAQWGVIGQKVLIYTVGVGLTPYRLRPAPNGIWTDNG